MKNSLILILAFVSVTACKTAENRESALDDKRTEIEAIAKKYLAISPTASADWAAFFQFISDDAIVEQLDLIKYEECLQSLSQHSNQMAAKQKDSDCEALKAEAKTYTGKAFIEFREKNMEAFSRCDSLRDKSLANIEQVILPCSQLLELSAQVGQKTSRNK
jgi:hypothetical protein